MIEAIDTIDAIDAIEYDRGYRQQIIKINTKAIQFVENFGYNRDFIIKSLQLNEINHAIATYYLYLSLLNE